MVKNTGYHENLRHKLAYLLGYIIILMTILMMVNTDL
jgi:hypothetical protein